MRGSRSSLIALGCAVIAGCSDSTGPGSAPPLECEPASTRVLAVGQHEIIDPSQQGACLRLPAAGAGGAEHLYVPLATAGEEAPDGISAPYLITGQAPVTAAPPSVPSPRLGAFQERRSPLGFHQMLRARERELARDPSTAFFSQGLKQRASSVPPAVGDQRSFQVCANTTCSSFVEASATARSVGSRVAIFVDDAAPEGGYDTAELDDVRSLFDQYLYPIDTTAFGRESDIDGNGVVAVLLTHRVNALSPDCNSTGRVILGYFFGADLLPLSGSNPGSNQAEVFYGLVPDPTNPQCTIEKAEAAMRLPATFIHEFQHMISFNQHVLIREGSSEDTWLNEGLSHFAEELGARLIPDEECPNSPSCASEFLGQGNLVNAFEYLADPEEFFLIEPGNSTGQLEERGANWLFVRWLIDHFASDAVLGGDLTRQLVATDQIGSANVVARTGVAFPTLVGEWQLTNYLDDLPGFSAPSSRLRYQSWNFRDVADANGIPYPLVPDSTSGVDYTRSGVLRAGSGRHVRVVQAGQAPAVDLKVTSPNAAALPGSIEPRVALVRIR